MGLGLHSISAANVLHGQTGIVLFVVHFTSQNMISREDFTRLVQPTYCMGKQGSCCLLCISHHKKRSRMRPSLWCQCQSRAARQKQNVLQHHDGIGNKTYCNIMMALETRHNATSLWHQKQNVLQHHDGIGNKTILQHHDGIRNKTCCSIIMASETKRVATS